MNNSEYLFEDYIKKVAESLEDNNYMTLIPKYYPSDFDDDDSYDFLWNDIDEWEGMKGVTCDNSRALEQPYYFTMYLWVYYDIRKEKEEIFKHFYDDFLAYSFQDDMMERELKELWLEYHIDMPYKRFMAAKSKYMKNPTGDADGWHKFIESVCNIMLGVRNCWGDLTIYRVICPLRDNGKESIDMSKLGNCWSYNLTDALRFVGKAYNHIEGDTHPFVIKAKCHPANIDWVRSAMLKFEYPKECELRVMDTDKLMDVQVFDIDGDKHPGKWVGTKYVLEGIND